MYDIEWAPGFKYARRALSRRAAVLGLQLRDGGHRDPVEAVRPARGRGHAAARRLYDPKSPDKKRFPLLPAYDQVLKCSNLFNTLDSRGAISVTERVGVIQRVRKMAVGVAQAWVDQQSGRMRPAEVAQ